MMLFIMSIHLFFDFDIENLDFVKILLYYYYNKKYCYIIILIKYIVINII